VTYFYALQDDAFEVVAFALEQPGWAVMEAYSPIGSALTSFRTIDGLRAALAEAAGPASLHLFVRVPEARGDVHIRRIEVGGPAYPHGSWRETVEGWGLIQLLFSTPRDGTLGRSRVAHNSKARATKWEATYDDAFGAVAAWDWKALDRAGRRVEAHVRRIAVAKEGPCPVLPSAHAAHRAGRVVLVA
jgi:hypothetical protein